MLVWYEICEYALTLCRSPSANKRFKSSVSPASTGHNPETEDLKSNGFLSPSTSASTTGLGEMPPKPQVTIAMLRALAQGILKSK